MTAITPKPPRPLSEPGRAFWDRVVSELELGTAVDLEQLALAAEAVDQIAAISTEIEVVGLMVGERAHPLLKERLGLTALVSRILRQLAAAHAPKRAPGRPPADLHWGGPHAAY
jgi:hypothetical protein